jgi:hypothetical protein
MFFEKLSANPAITPKTAFRTAGGDTCQLTTCRSISVDSRHEARQFDSLPETEQVPPGFRPLQSQATTGNAWQCLAQSIPSGQRFFCSRVGFRMAKMEFHV